MKGSESFAKMKILIVRLSAIGDIVMASPLAKAARVSHPEAHIAWLVQPEVEALLQANPHLDELIVWPRNRWRQLWEQRRWARLLQEMMAFRRLLRERRFDLVVDVQGLLKSGVLAWLSGAPQRIGLGSKEGSGWLMSRVIPKPEDPRIGSEYLYVARQLGWQSEPFRMEIALTAEDERFARCFIERRMLSSGYVVFAPFTTRPQKHWLEGYWAELARFLYQNQGLPAVVLGGAGDQRSFQRLADRFDTPLHGIVGESSLRQAAAVIKEARLVVGVDTGLTHMGIAMDVPTIALFGATCPYLDPRNVKARVIYKRYACSPCRRTPVCEGGFPCMKAISAREVATVAEELLCP